MHLQELLGCRFPIVQGGLAYVGNGRLAGAISAAGGFGQVGSAGRSVAELAQQIHVAAEHAAGCPFGVNLPLSEHSDREAYVKCIEEHASLLRAVSLSAGNPRPYIDRFRALGLIVIAVVATAEQARKVEAAGAHVVVAEGVEAGGHNGPAEMTTLTLVPEVVRAVSIPVVAAGGITSGAGIAAVLSLGAQGAQLGTRFVATIECEAHEHYKHLLVQTSGLDTVIMERSVGRVTRVVRTPYVDGILSVEATHPTWEQLRPYVQGSRNKVAAIEGIMEDGWVNCGQGVGQIHEILLVAVLMDRLQQETSSALERAATVWGQADYPS